MLERGVFERGLPVKAEISCVQKCAYDFGFANIHYTIDTYIYKQCAILNLRECGKSSLHMSKNTTNLNK